MNKKLQRLIEFGYIYFDEDDAGETGSGESSSESGKSESGSSETKSGSDSGESKATQQMRKYVYKGQTLELNDAQLDNVVALGLMKAEELQESRSKEETKEETKEEKPKEKLSPEQERINRLEKELADLKKDSRESSNDRILNDVNNVVDSYDFPDEARTDILKLILSDVALEMQEKKRPNVKSIAEKIAKRHAKLMKIDRNTDAPSKLSDRDKTKFDGKPGTTTKEDKLPKLGKKAFKNGDLAKRILERARQAHSRSTEG